MTNDIPDYAQVADDLIGRDVIKVSLEPYKAFCIVTQMRVALRHPDNFGRSAEIAIEFAQLLTEKLPESAQAVIRAGWNPANDE